ncbi:MAG: NrdJb [Pseudomonadota bacterium]
MTVKIASKIVGYEVLTPESESQPDTTAKEKTNSGAEVIRMTEKVERPDGFDCLEGATYKIRTPLDEHALYVTINDIILNKGTEHESRRPFEIFINSKNMDHFQWIVALTRVMSAVFRKGGDVTFLTSELQAVFDPRGGYFKTGGKFMPSLVAEIGAVVEHHMRVIGLIKDEPEDPAQAAMLAEKRAEIEAKDAAAAAQAAPSADGENYPESATLCSKCNTKAMVVMDNCETCLACGYSKCG